MARREGQRWGLLCSGPGRLEEWGIWPANGPCQLPLSLHLPLPFSSGPVPLPALSSTTCSFSDQLPSPCPFLTCGSPAHPLQLPPALSPFSLLRPLSSPFLEILPTLSSCPQHCPPFPFSGLSPVPSSIQLPVMQLSLSLPSRLPPSPASPRPPPNFLHNGSNTGSHTVSVISSLA